MPAPITATATFVRAFAWTRGWRCNRWRRPCEHLEGQPDWRRRFPNGRRPAPPHDAAGHTSHYPDRELFEITKKGPAAVAPGYESDMPACKDVLDDGEIWAVPAYIKSAWPAEIRARQQRINGHVAPGEGDGP